MTKMNGYAKRDAEIERLRTVMDNEACELEAATGHAANPVSTQTVLLRAVQRLRDALNRRTGP